MIDKEKIEAVGKFIIVERYEKPKKEKTIIIPGQDKEVLNMGYVISTNEESTITKGLFILWRAYQGQIIDKEQPNILYITDDDVIAILPEPNPCMGTYERNEETGGYPLHVWEHMKEMKKQVNIHL
jgi:co-chaperonin GroES (HSP10)